MSLPNNPAKHAWLRISGLIVGIALILWLPIEDANLNRVLFFASAVCTWGAARFMLNISSQDRKFLWRHILAGAVAGLAVSPVAIFLMAFKSGLHGHGVPDFSIGQILRVLVRFPVWVIAGTLLGLGVALARRSLSDH